MVMLVPWGITPVLNIASSSCHRLLFPFTAGPVSGKVYRLQLELREVALRWDGLVWGV